LTGDLARPMAKVLDFGISKLDGAGGGGITKTGMVLGTPAFMAPEQARGQRVDHRIDVYAVGAILYTLLTGRRPFDHEDQGQTLLAVMEEQPPRPRSLEPSIPDELELVIQRAMAKSADDRYQTISRLHEALAPWDPGDAAIAGAPARTAPFDALAARRAPTTLSGTAASVTPGFARPTLIAFGLAGAIWVFVGATSTIAGAIRLSRGGGPRSALTTLENVLLYVGLAVALATPVVLLVRHVRKTIWDNSVAVLELVPAVRDPVLFGLAAYGLGSLLLRAVLSTAELAAPEWDVTLGATGLVLTIVVAIVGRRRPRRASNVRPTLV
jgi:serine/threonine-protein kinase